MWFQLAHRLRMPVGLLRRQTSSRDFVKWQVYFRNYDKAKRDQRAADLTAPKPEHFYLATVCQYLWGILTKSMLPRENFMIPFSLEGAAAPQATHHKADPVPEEDAEAARAARRAAADDLAKARAFAVFGTPTNFEGWKTDGRTNGNNARDVGGAATR